MVDINWTVWVQIVNFLVLIFILNKVCFKPIRKILLARKEKIDGLNGSIDATSKEAQEKDKAFGQRLKEARSKGQAEKEALMQAASDEEKAIIAKINDKAREDLAAIKDQITKDTDAVKSALEKEVDSFADAITQKILGRAA
jgi:F-type H+-transporting ATPase subunit b